MKKTQEGIENDLREAFNFFDLDKSGYITSDELNKAFGGISDEEALTELMSEADANNDGKITYDEFKGLILKYFSMQS